MMVVANSKSEKTQRKSRKETFRNRKAFVSCFRFRFIDSFRRLMFVAEAKNRNLWLFHFSLSACLLLAVQLPANL